MLEINHIVKKFGASVTAVDDISLNLKGGVVGLIGHNGAGKTTLMQMIATLSKPTSGTMFFQGVDIIKSPNAIRERLGFLPQDFGVYPNLSALEIMQYFAGLKGVRNPDRIRQLLDLVNLSEHAHRSAATFSGGMRRRLGIAQALLNDPDILIVDEPTAGLDPEERLRFRNLLANLGEQKLVIISTHIVSDIESVATELAIMRQGKLVHFATPESMIESAYGRIWTAKVSAEQFAVLREKVQILQSQKQGDYYTLRMAHFAMPCEGAQLVQANLEDALMADHYASLDDAL